MAEIRIPAHHLQITDMLIPDNGGPPRRVTGCRLQGAQPTVVVHLAGTDQPHTYPAAALLTVHRTD